MASVRHRWPSRVLMLSLAGWMACSGPPPEAQTVPAEGVPAVASDALLLAAAKVALPPPGITLADLPNPTAPGADLIEQYCVACHAMPSPLAHSATDWPGVVRRMWLRIERLDPRYGVAVPNTAARFSMLGYLLDNSLIVNAETLPAGEGRDTFSATCSQCHELPDPRQHTGADWVSVVRRMSMHMEQLLGVSLGSSEMGEITNYLRTVSGGA